MKNLKLRKLIESTVRECLNEVNYLNPNKFGEPKKDNIIDGKTIRVFHGIGRDGTIGKVKNFKQFVNENYSKSNEMLLYVFDKNNNVIAFNLPSNDKDGLNKFLYDENGKNRGGYGAQLDDDKNYLKFNSIQDVQKWFDDNNEKHLLKATKNDSYPDLSNISLRLRKLKDINYTDINRGSCFKFAKEVSKLGYKHFTFIFSDEEQEVIHVYVKLSNNLYWDANGFHNKKEIISEYEIGKGNDMFDGDINELNHHCSIDTYQALTTIPIDNVTWDKIIQIININKN
jgi:hypothetical protein